MDVLIIMIGQNWLVIASVSTCHILIDKEKMIGFVLLTYILLNRCTI